MGSIFDINLDLRESNPLLTSSFDISSLKSVSRDSLKESRHSVTEESIIPMTDKLCP